MFAITGEDVARAISWLLGWSYFTSWSLSFYPQPLRCWKFRSTRGITVDFPLLNILGFTSYFISTTAFVCAPKIRQQYALRHPFAPEPTGGRDTPDSWAEIDIIYAFSYVKLIITLSKYAPQAWYNYKIKSTAGWAIDMIWLDFIGGIMSLLQLIIDSAMQADWSGITGNPAKLFLAVFSLCFDMVFFVQHYVLYRGKALPVDDEDEDETRPLFA
ncbi:hypothetical protein KCU73_g1849, partial [Aureobasidium melanogenum]